MVLVGKIKVRWGDRLEIGSYKLKNCTLSLDFKGLCALYTNIYLDLYLSIICLILARKSRINRKEGIVRRRGRAFSIVGWWKRSSVKYTKKVASIDLVRISIIIKAFIAFISRIEFLGKERRYEVKSALVII